MTQELDHGTAPRITPEHVNAQVKSAQYHVFPGTTLTVCCLTLRNGFTVTGESACADPANFNQQTGEHYAYKAALEKIWLLEGYLLRESLHQAEETRDLLASFDEGECEGCKI